ncbi:MAG: hypothetical protein JXR47_08225 [Thiotrichales bacterium]|jgi:hypothetical protein|nr:hypothetical protein [Thiotrichales bacterium]MBN2607309.1 hypothetical protein [Thiotrichales bacterium]
MKVKQVMLLLLTLSFLTLTACSKDPVKIVSAKLVDNIDRGSGNFDRMLQICFDKPLTSDYYHKVIIVTQQNFKLEGGNMLRPLASDPDNKCMLRNLYNYINKDSPVGARQMIKDYMTPGNISQILIQIYDDKPEGKGKPIAQALFKNL